jgi:von Willebrand factor type A domain.
LIDELQGDRVGLIAFAGRAFLQAPLTIDYDAVIEAVNDLDTKTIPEGGTNISSAITLATQSFGKSAMGNRALIIFTDGEELSGDAVKTAKGAPMRGANFHYWRRNTARFVDSGNRRQRRDELREGFIRASRQIKTGRQTFARSGGGDGGFYLHLENGPRTMQQVQSEGLAKMQAAEMDVRLSRRPIERYEWPLGGRVDCSRVVDPDSRAETRT